MSLLPRLLYALDSLRWRVTRPLTVGARLILERNGEIVLVRHTYQAQWYLPGGGVARGETIEEAVRREASEELGATLGPLHLFGVYSNFYEHKSDHVMVFQCHDFTLSGRRDHEIECVIVCGLDALPERTSPGTQRRIEEYRRAPVEPVIGRW